MKVQIYIYFKRKLRSSKNKSIKKCFAYNDTSINFLDPGRSQAKCLTCKMMDSRFI